ncbi:hypothetical protein BB561_004848 [Smittium simulii]|uniref:Sm domain-containing protein n=1 Tax=Smittium simulii TaxID=133385 RepID=A0A2T9YDU7_9FUNG|nr:hypothetical protein BB561_004848 [Smittium simulii]
MNATPNYQTDAVKLLAEQLNKKARVHISDGRVFEGFFCCVDNAVNLVLYDAVEFKQGNARRIGLISIPGKHILQFKVFEYDYV